MFVDPAMHTNVNIAKRNNRSALSSIRLFAVAGMIASLLGGGTVAYAAQPAPAPSAMMEIQFTKSVFMNTPGVGKDPFFPTSTRRGAPKTTTVVDVTPVAPLLSLKGISGPRNHRLAIINNKTFETGEEGDVRSGSQIVRVRCIEVKDDGVTVSINGQTQKLLLTPRL